MTFSEKDRFKTIAIVHTFDSHAVIDHAAKNVLEEHIRRAVELCEKFGFTEPLSLAVILDSLVHGSFFRVARTVQIGYADELAWITAYVRRRDGWLQSFPRLAAKRNRTRFFLDQVAISNWSLRAALTRTGPSVIRMENLTRTGRPRSDI